MQIQVGDKRGAHRFEVEQRNLLAVYRYYEANPGAAIIDCARSLGLSRHTVRKHINAINEGWEPDKNGA